MDGSPDLAFDRGAYARHVAAVAATWEAALEGAGFDAVVVPAGTSPWYFQDDQGPPFRPNPNFAQWAPMPRAEGSALFFRPGEQPRLVFLKPADYWHLPPTPPDWAEEAFALESHATAETLTAALATHVAGAGRVAYVGPPPAADSNLAFAAVNPEALLNPIHYARACKDDFEIGALRLAAEFGARGHLAARDAFASGASELDVHLAFLAASRQTAADQPYPGIVAQNDHAGVLHYQLYDAEPPPERRSLLIDAGRQHLGYAADITRTYSATADEFAELVAALDAAQQALIADIRPGVSYVDLHERMHRHVGELLHRFGLVSCGGETAFESGITDAFFPHGLGHLVGLQTHDVGGWMAAPNGRLAPPPTRYPALRLTRVVEAGQVFTVEPGIYFIPLLLDALRADPHGRDVNWPKVEAFLPCGGVRIEDNVAVTAAGVENLTRDAFARLE